ncbi:hypothetical protein [Phaeobacter sp. NW0010-22]|uniref:hypothetical protein n=1 Tax=Phaeobacter sp. NW0010-22 TaxID=3135907 RepID=UPI003101C599
MKRLLAMTVVAGSLVASAALSDESKSLVTVVTTAEPQTQLMAMVLTMQAAKQGATPHVLLCGPAGDIALKSAPDTVTAGQPPMDVSPQKLMMGILKQPGAKIEVCALYLPGKAAKADVLLDGIGVAKPGEMAGALLAADARLSF